MAIPINPKDRRGRQHACGGEAEAHEKSLEGRNVGAAEEEEEEKGRLGVEMALSSESCG